MSGRLNLHTIRKKFLFLLVLITTLSSVVTAATLIYYESVDAEEYHQDKLVLMSSIISPSLTAAIMFNDIDTINELIIPTVKTEGVFASYVYNHKNQLIANTQKNDINEQRLDDEYKVVTPLMLNNEAKGTLVFYADRSVINSKIAFYEKLLAQLLLGTLLVSLLLSIIFSKMITKPLSQLINVAKTVNKNNNYSIRAPYHSPDEIGELTQCFNAMLDTVENRAKKLELTVVNRTQALEEANKQLHHQAHEDALTGLPNRRSFYSFLNRLLEENKSFCLLFIDLDGFKQINDSLGHDFGDVLLQHASKRILNCVRSDDFVARLGGDEFTVVLRGLTDKERISHIIDAILHSLSSAFYLKKENIIASASIGATLCPTDSNDIDTLIKNADQAMYESKRKGKNCYFYFNSEIAKQLQNRKTKVTDLHQAFIKDEFEIYYQPILNLQTNKVRKAEALIRWNHPTKGLIFPDNFLDTIEEENLMDELGYWVANRVLSDRLKWQKLTTKHIELSINLTSSQFKSSSHLLQKWLDHVETLELPPNAFAFEITEHLLIQNSEKVRSMFNTMRSKGFRIAIDDFGVGYSSLSYLQELNIDTLKIDRSFINKVTIDKRSYGLCKGIVTIAQELGLTVVAEGIETEEQHLIASEIGCHYGQGYLYAKPMKMGVFQRTYITNPEVE